MDIDIAFLCQWEKNRVEFKKMSRNFIREFEEFRVVVQRGGPMLKIEGSSDT